MQVAHEGLFVSDGAAPGKSQRWKAASGFRVNTSTTAVRLLEKSVRSSKGSQTAFDGHAMVFVWPRQQSHETTDLLVYEPLAGELTDAAPAVIEQLRPRVLRQSTPIGAVHVYRGLQSREHDCFVRALLCLGWLCKAGLPRASDTLRALCGEPACHVRWNNSSRKKRRL